MQAVEVQLLSQSHLGKRRARWPNYPAVMGSESNEEHPITGSFWGLVAWPASQTTAELWDPGRRRACHLLAFESLWGLPYPSARQAGYLACSCQPPLELEACRVRQGCEKLERGGLLREACPLL